MPRRTRRGADRRCAGPGLSGDLRSRAPGVGRSRAPAASATVSSAPGCAGCRTRWAPRAIRPRGRRAGAPRGAGVFGGPPRAIGAGAPRVRQSRTDPPARRLPSRGRRAHARVPSRLVTSASSSRPPSGCLCACAAIHGAAAAEAPADLAFGAHAARRGRVKRRRPRASASSSRHSMPTTALAAALGQESGGALTRDALAEAGPSSPRSREHDGVELASSSLPRRVSTLAADRRRADVRAQGTDLARATQARRTDATALRQLGEGDRVDVGAHHERVARSPSLSLRAPARPGKLTGTSFMECTAMSACRRGAAASAPSRTSPCRRSPRAERRRSDLRASSSRRVRPRGRDAPRAAGPGPSQGACQSARLDERVAIRIRRAAIGTPTVGPCRPGTTPACVNVLRATG